LTREETLRRFALAGLAFLVSVLCHATPALADAYAVRDNRGHVTIMNEGGEDSVAAASGPVNIFTARDWDVNLMFGAQAQNNDSGDEERALAAIGAMAFVGSNLGIGGQIARPDLGEPHVIELSPKLKMYVARDPSASWTKGFLVLPFSYTFATGDNSFGPDGTRFSGGAFSFAPTAKGFLEWPLQSGSAEISAGITRVITQLSEDVPDESVWNLGFTYNWWAIR